jgi:hypothetical protein
MTAHAGHQGGTSRLVSLPVGNWAEHAGVAKDLRDTLPCRD